jgi:hypothetical protein
MLSDLFGAADLEPDLAVLRRRANIAWWRTMMRFRRKRAWTTVTQAWAPPDADYSR